MVRKAKLTIESLQYEGYEQKRILGRGSPQ